MGRDGKTALFQKRLELPGWFVFVLLCFIKLCFDKMFVAVKFLLQSLQVSLELIIIHSKQVID